HTLFGAQFTATSMIGMIALAGIIVRNSILLVDFIKLESAAGMKFADAIIMAAAVRAKPIVLTGVAAMIRALFILDDPIFTGLAISLIGAILLSSPLPSIVIPPLYHPARRRAHAYPEGRLRAPRLAPLPAHPTRHPPHPAPSAQRPARNAHRPNGATLVTSSD